MCSWDVYGIVVLLLFTYVESYGYFSRCGLAWQMGRDSQVSIVIYRKKRVSGDVRRRPFQFYTFR